MKMNVNVMEMRAQRKISRSISRANRTQDNTWVNSRGPLETNLVETPATRIPRKRLLKMIPRATRPAEGQTRYLKLAAAGVLCITLVLLVPHVGQEKKHRALGFDLDNPDWDEMEENPDFKARVKALQRARCEEAAVNDMIFKLQEWVCNVKLTGEQSLVRHKQIVEPTSVCHISEATNNTEQSTKYQTSDQLLLLYYYANTEGRRYTGDKKGLISEISQNRFKTQCIKAFGELEKNYRTKQNEKYFDNWKTAVEFYRANAHKPIYRVKAKSAAKDATPCGIYTQASGRYSETTYHQHRFVELVKTHESAKKNNHTIQINIVNNSVTALLKKDPYRSMKKQKGNYIFEKLVLGPLRVE